MNRLSERGQPCPHESSPRHSRTRLSALLSVAGSWSRCVILKSWRLSMNRTPSSRPSPPVGEKVPGGRLRGIPTGSWLRFTSGFLEVFPSHEPYSQVIGNEQNNRDRFMASIHVRILEVSPSHEPYPLIPSFSPSGGEGARRAVEGDCDRFMASIHVRILEVLPPHEPNPRSAGFQPAVSPTSSRPDAGGS